MADPSSDKDKKGGKPLGLKDYASVSSIGINMGVSIVLGIFIGKYLDGYFDTKPLLTMVFIVLGFVAGILNAYRVIKRIGLD